MSEAPVTPNELTNAILAVRERLVASGRYASHAAINAGYCGDFADDVMEHLGRSHTCVEPYQVGVEGFMEGGQDADPTVMDRALIAAHWPGFAPPEGMDWDDVDAMAAECGFSTGTHTWLCLGSLHYDAETPEGVANFLELPFFRRMAEGWLADRAPGPRA